MLNLWKQIDSIEIEICTIIFKRTVQRVETGGLVEKQIPKAVHVIQQSVATRKFPCILHTFVERMEKWWTIVSYGNELRLQIIHSVMQ